MTLEEAERKANEAIEMDLIKPEMFEEYVQHLLEKHGEL